MVIAGSIVTILAPFDTAFPGQYIVEGVSGTTAKVQGVGDFDFRFLTVVGQMEVQPPPNQPITKLTFMRRMTAGQRIAIRQAAQTDSILADAMQMLDAAENISTDDTDTVALINYCAQLGLISVDDIPIILA